MQTGHNVGWMLATLLVAVFLAGAWELVLSPLESGEVYPPYSSLRADPLGTKALFESLAGLSELRVSRLYRRGRNLNPDTTLFELGIDSASWIAQPESAWADYERVLAGGGRLVIGFLPAPMPVSQPREGAILERLHVRARYRKVANEERDAGLIPRESTLTFDAGPEWSVLRTSDGGATVIYRNLAGGTLVLVADSFPLSNQGLAQEHDTAAITQLVGDARSVVFDESHFGVTEAGSVGVLLRKYRLEGALSMLGIVAGLFIWRNASSFLPSRKSSRQEAVAGRDSREGMTALLHRSVSEKELLQVCWTQWSRSAIHEARAARVKSEIERGTNRNMVEAYRAACRVLTERK